MLWISHRSFLVVIFTAAFCSSLFRYSQVFSIACKYGDNAGLSIKVTLFWSYTFLQCGLCEQVHCHPWKSSVYLQHTRQLLAISSCLGCQYVLGELMLPLTAVRVPVLSTQIYLQIIKLVVWVVLFVLFSPNVNVVVYTEHNLTFVGKCYFFSSSCLLFDLFALDSLFWIHFPNHHFLFC